uniref:Uncharacterized protein n=1 Tax=Oryza barthii TaxID=65489 RepID=A0A0D3H5X9_9ORYZ
MGWRRSSGLKDGESGRGKSGGGRRGGEPRCRRQLRRRTARPWRSGTGWHRAGGTHARASRCAGRRRWAHR